MTARNQRPAEASELESSLDVAAALMRAAFVLKQVVQRRLTAAEASATPAELALLHLLSLEDGQRVGALSDATTRDRTVVTRIADRLVKRGLVKRREDAQDRRAVCLWITEAGRALHEGLFPLRQDIVARATAHLSPPEREALVRALVELRTQLLEQIEED